MRFLIPERLQHRAAAVWGREGEKWVDSLSGRLQEIEREWSLTLLEPWTTGGTCSWVGPVRTEDGSAAVLKINYPERDSLREADALRLIDGCGAARLLRAGEDGLCLLLERCSPGTDLWAAGVEEGNTIGAALLQQIWRQVPPGASFDPVSRLTEEWRRTLPAAGPAGGYEPELVETAIHLAATLEQSSPERVLLHGDFHPANVLASGRQPWLAIDPKPLVVDSAYDLAQWMGNRCEMESPDPAGALLVQICQMSRQLNLDPERVARWAFVKSLGWDWGPPFARNFYKVLDAGGWGND